MTAAAQPSAAAVAVLTALLEARTGQHLDRNRAWRIETSLQPLLRERGLASLDALAGVLSGDRDPALATRAVDALLNQETSFFRDPGIIEAVAQVVGTMIADGARPRIWSAGCSTGQEIYSLALALIEAGHCATATLPEMLATDVSAATVERAATGRYSQFEAQRGMPIRTLLAWFVQDDENWTLDPRIAGRVRFRQHDLNTPPPPGRFDVILCRNVLMYFPLSRRCSVLAALAGAMAPGGVLVLGAGETVIGLSDDFVPCRTHRGLYRRAATPNHIPSPARASG